jgi:hypothetical protein
MLFLLLEFSPSFHTLPLGASGTPDPGQCSLFPPLKGGNRGGLVPPPPSTLGLLLPSRIRLGGGGEMEFINRLQVIR